MKPIMKSIKKTAGRQSGFTLVEVLIAMVVLTVGLLVIAAAFSQGMLVLAGTPMQLAAKELADEIIDDYTVRKDAGTLGTMNYGRQPTVRRITRDGRAFDVDINVTSNFNPATANVDVRVEVTVSYQVGGRPRSYTTTTLIN